MKLYDIDQAVMLRNHRKKALDLMHMATSGLISCEIVFNGGHMDPFSVISAIPVRDAIKTACFEFLEKNSAELVAIGVVPTDIERVEGANG